MYSSDNIHTTKHIQSAKPPPRLTIHIEVASCSIKFQQAHLDPNNTHNTVSPQNVCTSDNFFQ